METGKDLIGVARVQELYGDIQEIGPLGGKVGLQNLLQGWNELRSNVGGCGSEDRQYPVAKIGLFFVGNWLVELMVFSCGPPS